MKNKLYIILFSGLVGITLVACNKQVSNEEEARVILEQYGDYTYKNYSVGCQEYFVVETGNAKEYRITQSDMITAVISIDKNELDEEINKGFDHEIESKTIIVTMVNEHDANETIALTAYCAEENNLTDIAWAMGIGISHPTTTIKNAQPSFALADDEMYLENETGQWMVLKKGIGIARMGDSHEHTWVTTRKSTQNILTSK